MRTLAAMFFAAAAPLAALGGSFASAAIFIAIALALIFWR
jgi:hypothetical protein